MRDPLAPVIEGYDLSGIVNPYSFQCTPFYEEGDNGGTLMDGTTIHDILAAKIRLSWTLKALSAQQYADLSAALNSGPSPDTVDAYVFDPTRNINIFARFHVSAPEWLYAVNAPVPMSFADAELTLEEAEFFVQFAVTPPNKTTYNQGETLNLTGLTVTQYDNNGNGVDITEQCTFSPADGTELLTAGNIPLIVILPGGFEWVADLQITVTPPIPIASGDWWTLYNNGLLDIYCVGAMPKLPLSTAQNNMVKSVVIRGSVTSIAYLAFDVNRHRNLTSVSIEDGVTGIGQQAFYALPSLTSVVIPDSVNYIGPSAFDNCKKLSNIRIPYGVTTIGETTFTVVLSLV